jgi:hypothetical protein
MHIPVIKGIIKRRLLVNFRADPAIVQGLLPEPFRPKIHQGHAIVGICLIRLEKIRPAPLPGALGISSENAAHRVAVEWEDAVGIQREGVYIPRRDTDSILNRMAGGRIFPGEHHFAKFTVVDQNGRVKLSMQASDHAVSVRVTGEDAERLPNSSCFNSLSDASAFFEGGSLGYSPVSGGSRLDGLVLHTHEWKVRALAASEARSSYFEDESRFPKGSVEFDHCLIMRDIQHEWHNAAEPARAYQPSMPVTL